MLFNPFFPFSIIKVASLKSTIFILLILLLKTNLLRIKGGIIGGLFALTLLSGIAITSSIALGSLIYASRAVMQNKSDEPETNVETDVISI